MASATRNVVPGVRIEFVRFGLVLNHWLIAAACLVIDFLACHTFIMEPDALSRRMNKLPKWARDYIHQVETFIGAPEVQELTYLLYQNRQLVKLVAELKAQNRRLQKRLALIARIEHL